jgi:imidazole glycerol-phosphate synthase subunit HisH
MSEVAIVDSGGANLTSLKFALERLGARARVTNKADEISTAARVLLPGVGAAPDAMQRLHAAGLVTLLPRLRQPVLGICLGMQLLYERSQEGDVACLGILEGEVYRLQAARGRPVPHMGWNRVEPLRPDELTAGIGPGEYLYFVHGFAGPVNGATVASVSYGDPLPAVVRAGNFWGVQFHPERSAAAGARVLENFLRVAA